MGQCPNLPQQFRQTPHMLKENQPAPAVQQPVEKCGFCGTPGHNMRTCRKWKRMQESTATQGQTTKYCQNCQIQNDTSECRGGPRTKDYKTTPTNLPPKAVCGYCGTPGHTMMSCRKWGRVKGHLEGISTKDFHDSQDSQDWPGSVPVIASLSLTPPSRKRTKNKVQK